MEPTASEERHPAPAKSSRSGSRESSFSVAAFGMGCFWGPEALFGSLAGVMLTRVGYTGGSTPNPTYRELGDHTETVQLCYDEDIISFETIIRTFWDHHNPYNINGYKGRQYQSLLYYRDASQLAAIETELARREREGLGRPDTEIAAYAEFHPAEDRHQKYYVKRFPRAVGALESLYPARSGEGTPWLDTTIAARLNGMAKGYLNMERLKSELESWELSEAERKRLVAAVTGIRW
jgi:peptide-methionine (S)-S-oxide reductase